MKQTRNNTISLLGIDSEPDVPNYGEALRLLKNAQMQLQKKKKQLKVQAIRAHRGGWTQQQEQIRKKIREESKASTQKALMQFQNMKSKEAQKLAQLRKHSEMVRQENIKNKSKSRLQLIQNKIRLRQQIKNQSKYHQKKVEQLRKQSLQRKQSHCLELYQDLRSSRAHASQYKADHMASVRNVKSRQRDDLLSKLQQRQKELEDLNQQTSSISLTKTEKEVSTTDIKSREQLPYTRRSSYLKNRRKSISEIKLDASRPYLMLVHQ